MWGFRTGSSKGRFFYFKKGPLPVKGFLALLATQTFVTFWLPSKALISDAYRSRRRGRTRTCTKGIVCWLLTTQGLRPLHCVCQLRHPSESKYKQFHVAD